MIRSLFAVLIAACATLLAVPVVAQNTAPPPPAQNTTRDTNHPRRAQAQLAGFDLAPDKASANQIGGASRGVGSATLVLYAPHKGLVYSLRPSFWWRGDPNASYTFHIQDVTGGSGWDRPVTGVSLTYPADAPPLVAGKTYLWRIEPSSPLLGPPPPAAMIVVMSDADRATIDAAVSAIPGHSVDAGIARAKVYFDHRLWYDAVMQYDDLIAQNPGQGQLYGLRGAVYDQLPVTQPLADADYTHAQ